MSTPTPQEVAQRVHDYFVKFPEKHDQETWFMVVDGENFEEDPDLAVVDVENNVCNTSMCVAGTVMWNEYGRHGLRQFVSGSDNERMATRHAGDLLGLNAHQAHWLFYYSENDEAKRVVKRIAKGKKNPFKDTDYEPEANWY